MSKKDKTGFDIGVEIVATIGFMVMVAIVILQIIFRSLSWMVMDWGFEFAAFLFVVTIFMGAAVAMRTNEHIRLEFLFNWLSPRPRLLLQLVLDILGAVFLITVAIGAYQMAGITWEAHNVNIEWMRTGHYYVALLFGTLLILFYLLANIMRHMRDLAAGRFQNPVSAAEHSALPGGGPGKRQED